MEKVLKALDLLGLALVNHRHVWTKEERAAYERAIAYIAKHKNTA